MSGLALAVFVSATGTVIALSGAIIVVAMLSTGTQTIPDWTLVPWLGGASLIGLAIAFHAARWYGP